MPRTKAWEAKERGWALKQNVTRTHGRLLVPSPEPLSPANPPHPPPKRCCCFCLRGTRNVSSVTPDMGGGRGRQGLSLSNSTLCLLPSSTVAKLSSAVRRTQPCMRVWPACFGTPKNIQIIIHVDGPVFYFGKGSCVPTWVVLSLRAPRGPLGTCSVVTYSRT